MAAQTVIDDVAETLRGWTAQRQGEGGDDHDLTALATLATGLARLDSLAAEDIGDLSLDDDVDGKAKRLGTDWLELGQRAWSDAIADLTKETTTLTDAVERATARVGHAATAGGTAADKLQGEMDDWLRQAGEAITTLAAEVAEAPTRFADHRATALIEKGRGDAQAIAGEHALGAARLLQTTLHQMSGHEAAARAGFERALGVLSGDIQGLEESLRARLTAALDNLPALAGEAIRARAIAAVEAELEQAVAAIAEGAALNVALSGPWLAAIHVARMAMDRL